MNRRNFIAGAGLAAAGIISGVGVQQLAAQDPTPTVTPGTAATPGKSATPATPVASPAASPVSADFVIGLKDIFFVPKAFTIPANQDVTLALVNSGLSAHTFTITELDIDVRLTGGQSTVITINAPAGTYTYFCAIPGHNLAGMHGQLTVR